jgi:hypothetical protein
MNLRLRIKNICVAIIAAFAGVMASCEDATERPNVLFIIIDDLNDWVGAYGGNPDTLTPNIDRLAQAGTRFTNAHAADRNGTICQRL